MHLHCPVSVLGAGWVLIALLAASSGRSTPVPLPSAVSVRAVQCERLRDRGGWFELAVELVVARSAGPMAPVDRVRVRTSLAYEAGSGNEKTWRFFESWAETVSLAPGTATLRFYLPPEIVTRDRVQSDALLYAIEIEVGGAPQSVSAAATSRTLRPPGARERFLERTRLEAVTTTGVFVPQHLSPFAFDADRPSPSVNRTGEMGPR